MAKSLWKKFLSVVLAAVMVMSTITYIPGQADKADAANDTDVLTLPVEIYDYQSDGMLFQWSNLQLFDLIAETDSAGVRNVMQSLMENSGVFSSQKEIDDFLTRLGAETNTVLITRNNETGENIIGNGTRLTQGLLKDTLTDGVPQYKDIVIEYLAYLVKYHLDNFTPLDRSEEIQMSRYQFADNEGELGSQGEEITDAINQEIATDLYDYLYSELDKKKTIEVNGLGNPGFEASALAGDGTGWHTYKTTSGEPRTREKVYIDWEIVNNSNTYAAATGSFEWMSNNYCLFAHTDMNGADKLSRSFSVVPGQTYSLSFDFAPSGQVGAKGGAVKIVIKNGENELVLTPVSSNATTEGNNAVVRSGIVPAGGLPKQAYNYRFTPVSDNITVEIYNLNEIDGSVFSIYQFNICKADAEGMPTLEAADLVTEPNYIRTTPMGEFYKAACQDNWTLTRTEGGDVRTVLWTNSPKAVAGPKTLGDNENAAISVELNGNGAGQNIERELSNLTAGSNYTISLNYQKMTSNIVTNLIVKDAVTGNILAQKELEDTIGEGNANDGYTLNTLEFAAASDRVLIQLEATRTTEENSYAQYGMLNVKETNGGYIAGTDTQSDFRFAGIRDTWKAYVYRDIPADSPVSEEYTETSGDAPNTYRVVNSTYPTSSDKERELCGGTDKMLQIVNDGISSGNEISNLFEVVNAENGDYRLRFRYQAVKTGGDGDVIANLVVRNLTNGTEQVRGLIDTTTHNTEILDINYSTTDGRQHTVHGQKMHKGWATEVQMNLTPGDSYEILIRPVNGITGTVNIPYILVEPREEFVLGTLEESRAKTYGNIQDLDTCYDYAYYMLSNLFNPSMMNQKVDAYDTLTLRKNTLNLDADKDGVAERHDSYLFKQGLPIEYDLTNRDIHNVDTATDEVKLEDGFFPVREGMGFVKTVLGEDSVRYHNWNNTAQDINYHYTMKSSGKFVYKEAENLVFDFTGDDDVYLFINNKLALDIGSAHLAASHRAVLNDMADELGLVEGGIYDFDFFYMERKTVFANIEVNTNIKVLDPTAVLTKTAQHNGVRIADGGSVNINSEIGYQFTLLSEERPLNKIVFYDDKLDMKIGWDEVTVGKHTYRDDETVDGLILTIQIPDENAEGGYAVTTYGGSGTAALTAERIKELLTGTITLEGAAESVVLPQNSYITVGGVKYTVKESDYSVASGSEDKTRTNTARATASAPEYAGSPQKNVNSNEASHTTRLGEYLYLVDGSNGIGDILPIFEEEALKNNDALQNANGYDIKVKYYYRDQDGNLVVDENASHKDQYLDTGNLSVENKYISYTYELSDTDSSAVEMPVFYIELTDTNGNPVYNTGVMPIKVVVLGARNDVYVLDYGLPAELNEGDSASADYKYGVFANDVLSYDGDIKTKLTLERMNVNGGAYTELKDEGADGFTLTGTEGSLVAKNTVLSTRNDTSKVSLLYTPSTFMDAADTFCYKVSVMDTMKDSIGLPGKDGIVMEANIKVVPASVVYYEDNFGSIQYVDSAVSKEGVSNVPQQSINQDDAYGYDPVYNGKYSTVSGGTSVTLNAVSAVTTAAQFDFTGTGFDLVGTINDQSTILKVVVRDANNKLVKSQLVDTGYAGAGSLYQVPVVHMDLGTYGTYKVIVAAMKAGPIQTDRADAYKGTRTTFVLDGIRIYNPLYDNQDYSNDEISNMEMTGSNMLKSSDFAASSLGDLGSGTDWEVWNSIGAVHTGDGNGKLTVEIPAGGMSAWSNFIKQMSFKETFDYSKNYRLSFDIKMTGEGSKGIRVYLQHQYGPDGSQCSNMIERTLTLSQSGDTQTYTYDSSLVTEDSWNQGEANGFHQANLVFDFSRSDTSDTNGACTLEISNVSLVPLEGTGSFVTVTEVRDMLINKAADGNTLSLVKPGDGTNWKEGIQKGFSVVEDQAGGTTVTSSIDGSADNVAADYINAGPNNELYIADGYGIAFKVVVDNAARNKCLQIEAKSLNQSSDDSWMEFVSYANGSKQVIETIRVQSATAMYYKVPLDRCQVLSSDGSTTTYLVVLQTVWASQASTKVLSLSNIKYSGLAIQAVWGASGGNADAGTIDSGNILSETQNTEVSDSSSYAEFMVDENGNRYMKKLKFDVEVF